MSRKHTAIAAAILVSALSARAGALSPAHADSKRWGWDGEMMMGPGMMGSSEFGFMCNPRHAGMAEWRFNQIESAVKLNEAQTKALNDLRTASSKAADGITAACSTDVPAKASERMAAMEKRLGAMHDAIKTVRPAFDTFYTSLDEPQKAQVDAAGPRRWGWMRWHWSWGDKDGD